MTRDDFQNAFLAAIRANPADDTARLVYADWLQEHGEDGWAELIRVQVELARPVPEPPASLRVDLFSSAEHVLRVEEHRATVGRRERLDRREHELLAAVRVPVPDGWAVRVGLGIGSSTRGHRGDLFLRRGLAERAVGRSEAWVGDGDAILSRHPVERVRLTSVPPTNEADGTVRLQGDPLEKWFSWIDVRAEWREGDPVPARYGWCAPLLRLRFGTAIVFELPG